MRICEKKTAKKLFIEDFFYHTLLSITELHKIYTEKSNKRLKIVNILREKSDKKEFLVFSKIVTTKLGLIKENWGRVNINTSLTTPIYRICLCIQIGIYFET